MKGESRRKQLTIKFLICQNEKAKINDDQFFESQIFAFFCATQASEAIFSPIRNRLRQWRSDRFTVITFSISHQLSEFHFVKAAQKYPSNFLSPASAMISDINQKETLVFLLDSVKGEKQRKKKRKIAQKKSES